MNSHTPVDINVAILEELKASRQLTSDINNKSIQAASDEKLKANTGKVNELKDSIITDVTGIFSQAAQSLAVSAGAQKALKPMMGLIGLVGGFSKTLKKAFDMAATEHLLETQKEQKNLSGPTITSLLQAPVSNPILRAK